MKWGVIVFTYTLQAFKGSFLNKMKTGETFMLPVNELNPGSVECDCIQSPYNPWSYNHAIAVFLTSREKLNTLFGGDTRNILFYASNSYASSRPGFDLVFPSCRHEAPLNDRMWINPSNDNFLVCFEHWRTKHRNGDVTFERSEPTGPDVVSKKHYDSGIHAYNSRGNYFKKLPLERIFFVYPGETPGEKPLYGIDSYYYTFFQHWEQESGKYVIDYYFPDGTHWPTGEAHDILYYNTGDIGGSWSESMKHTTMKVKVSELSAWSDFLFYKNSYSPSVFWGENYSQEIFFHGSFHRSGWWYRDNKWEHVWERCPFIAPSDGR